jgi:hypothetical protein
MMAIDSVTLEGVEGRHASGCLIPTDRRSALRVARAIRHPWYRCQALAMIAESEPNARHRNELLEESVSAAYELTEPNRVVSVATWPLTHLIWSIPERAHAVVLHLLRIIATEPHGLRKLDGLSRMLFTVCGTPTLREQVLPPFLSAASASAGWRTERIIGCAVEVLANSDPTTAAALLSSRTPNRFSRRAGLKLLMASSETAADYELPR